MIAWISLSHVPDLARARRPLGRSGRRPGRRTRRAPGRRPSGPPRSSDAGAVDGQQSDRRDRRSGSARARRDATPRPLHASGRTGLPARSDARLDPGALLRPRLGGSGRAAPAAVAAGESALPRGSPQPSGCRAAVELEHEQSAPRRCRSGLTTWRQIACAVASGSVAGADRSGSSRRSGHARRASSDDRHYQSSLLGDVALDGDIAWSGSRTRPGSAR